LTDNADGTATINIGVPGNNGDVQSSAGLSIDNELVLFDGATGKIIKRASQTGIVKLTAGKLEMAGAGDLETLVGDAGADAAPGNPGTKGVATFWADDFDAATGQVRLDYLNGQKATGAVSGFLSAADHGIFSSKAPGNAHYLTTTAEGGLSAESNLGALTTGLLKITVGGGIATPSTAAGGVDYVTPAGLTVKVDTARNISTTAPITGGGDMTQDRTLGCPTCVTTAAPLVPDAPLLAAGANSVVTGSLSGNTTIVGTVSDAPGAKTSNKQVIFDVNGNLVASAFDAGATGQGSATWGSISGTLANQVDLQNALNTKPTATLSTNTNLGQSDTTVPSQNAVYQFTTAQLALKQNTITADAGLSSSGSGWFTASTEANFLTQNASSDLTVGVNQGGKMAVRTDTARLQYTAGAVPTLYSGYLLPSPLTYNILATLGTCTGGGKLNVNGSNQVECQADQTGPGGDGTVTQITATAPIIVTPSPLTVQGVVSIADALADGATKGAAAFNGNDFTTGATPGIVSLNYAAAQAASTSTKGFLTATDWNTFNDKQDALGFTAVPDTLTVNGHTLDQNVVVTGEDVGLGNLTNVAQLTRAAGDFEAGTITEKAQPVGDDVVLLEDSAAAKAKKWAKLSSLPAAGITIKEQDNDPSVSNVTEIRVSNDTLTFEGAGIVTIATGGGPGGGGDASTNTSSTVAGQLATFADATGKLLGASGAIGVVVLTSPESVVSTVAAPTSALAGVDDVQTFTNKTIIGRTIPLASATTVDCNANAADTCTMANTEAVGNTLTIAPPAGANFVNTQKLAYRVQCTNPLPYSFDAVFRWPGDVPQPLTCSTAGPDYWLASWNTTSSTWDILTAIQYTGSAGTAGGHIIFDEQVQLSAQGKLRFTGGGITCAANPGAGSIDCDVPGGGLGSAYATMINQSTLPALPQRSTIDIVGNALQATDDPGNLRTKITLVQSPASSASVVGTERTLTLHGTADEIVITGSVTQNLASNPDWTIGIPDNAILSVARLSNLTTNGVIATTGGNGTLQVITPMTNPMTTAGDIIIGGVSPAGTPTRLAGAAGFLKGAVGSGPSYSAIDLNSVDVTGDLPYANLRQAQAASRLLGRGSLAGAGDWEEVTLGTNLSLSGTTLNATGGVDPSVVAISQTSGVMSPAPDGTAAGIVIYVQYGVTGALTIPAPTGTPVDGKELRFILRSALPQDLTFTSGAAGFDADAGLPLPHTTTGNNIYDYFTYRYNLDAGQWFLVGATQATGAMGVASGGTGVDTLTPHGVLVGQATAPVVSLAPTANSQCFMSDATDYATTDPSWRTCPTAGGTVLSSGTPVAGQLATWTDATTITGLTATATLPQNGALVFCNTADCTTNYERGQIDWSGNTFRILTTQGGSGSIRQVSLASGNGGVATSNGGIVILGSASGFATLAPNIAGVGLSIRGGESSDAGAINLQLTGTQVFTPTSGLTQGVSAVHTFAPTSGTASYAGININDTINQTGGANGLTRGIYINPTLTAAADYRSLAFNGQYPHAIQVERHPTADSAGSSLSVRAGGATTGATDKNGGVLVLRPGTPTGTGRSWVEHWCATTAASTGTSDGTQYRCGVHGVARALTDGSATNVATLAVATNTANSVRIPFAVTVLDASNQLQIVDGVATCRLYNSADTIGGNTCTVLTHTPALQSGTLSVAFAISAANPGQITVTADTSLTPAAGYPRMRYSAEVLGEGALTVQ
jgi:hypothetical protein